ncbi:MAG: hypothetical protein ACTHK7_15710 [Aureliella sp.]
MNAPRPTPRRTTSSSSAASTDAPRSWWLSPRGRAVLSVVIFLHLLAVVGEPLRMFSQGRQPGSPEAQLVRGGLAPYIDFAYLHHGYFFFAPNPGPSHLMDIKLIDADGSARHLRLPNHRAQWPRLLYHRHFMLSEFLFQLYTPAPSGLGPDVQVPEELLRDRALFERVRSSMEEHLAVRYGAQRAEIQLMEHRLPNAVEVFDRGMKLTDEQLYLLLPDQPEPPAESSEPLPEGQSRKATQALAGEKAAASDKPAAASPDASPAPNASAPSGASASPGTSASPAAPGQSSQPAQGKPASDALQPEEIQP